MVGPAGELIELDGRLIPLGLPLRLSFKERP